MIISWLGFPSLHHLLKNGNGTGNSNGGTDRHRQARQMRVWVWWYGYGTAPLPPVEDGCAHCYCCCRVYVLGNMTCRIFYEMTRNEMKRVVKWIVRVYIDLRVCMYEMLVLQHVCR